MFRSPDCAQVFSVIAKVHEFSLPIKLRWQGNDRKLRRRPRREAERGRATSAQSIQLR